MTVQFGSRFGKFMISGSAPKKFRDGSVRKKSNGQQIFSIIEIFLFSFSAVHNESHVSHHLLWTDENPFSSGIKPRGDKNHIFAIRHKKRTCSIDSFWSSQHGHRGEFIKYRLYKFWLHAKEFDMTLRKKTCNLRGTLRFHMENQNFFSVQKDEEAQDCLFVSWDTNK